MDVSQAGYAVITAAFITGMWALIAQKSKAKDDGLRDSASAEILDRQNLVQNYRDFNMQLQSRITELNRQVTNLWESLNNVQKLLDESESVKNVHTRKIIEFESKVASLTEDVEECKRDKKDLERENGRLYRILSGSVNNTTDRDG